MSHQNQQDVSEKRFDIVIQHFEIDDNAHMSLMRLPPSSNFDIMCTVMMSGLALLVKLTCSLLSQGLCVGIQELLTFSLISYVLKMPCPPF